MCKVLYRSVFVVKALIGTLFFAGYMTGNEKITIPMERVRSALPDVNFGLSTQRQSGTEMHLSHTLENVRGYEFDYGRLVRLSNGTCEQCMGSPKSVNSHIAVAMNRETQLPDSCPHIGTDLSTCFTLRKTDAMVIIVPGPPDDTFDEFSWGVYLYDRMDVSSRDLIQAPLYDPLRLTRSDTHALVIGFVPEIVDHLMGLLESEYVTHPLPVQERYVRTGDLPQDNDRISVLLKTLPKRRDNVEELYRSMIDDSRVMLFKLKDDDLTREYAASSSYSRFIRHSTTDGRLGTERETFERDIETEIPRVPVPDSITRMRDLRNILGTTDIERCIEMDMNCLAEDWDVSYTVSESLVFPRDPRFKTLVMGVNHPQASRTTLGLYDAKTNMEVMSIPDLSRGENVYRVWIAANCSTTKERCYEIPTDENYLFLRERIYGVPLRENMVEPFVIRYS